MNTQSSTDLQQRDVFGVVEGKYKRQTSERSMQTISRICYPSSIDFGGVMVHNSDDLFRGFLSSILGLCIIVHILKYTRNPGFRTFLMTAL